MAKQKAGVQSQEKKGMVLAQAPEAGKKLSLADIARRAYELYQARGGEHGRADQDWYQAERELKLGKQ
jgi:hypothetical protein